jgi:hypothetical protein
VEGFKFGILDVLNEGYLWALGTATVKCGFECFGVSVNSCFAIYPYFINMILIYFIAFQFITNC